MLIKHQFVLAAIASCVLAACGGGAGSDPAGNALTTSGTQTSTSQGASSGSGAATGTTTTVTPPATTTTSGSDATTGGGTTTTVTPPTTTTTTPATPTADPVVVAVTIGSQPQSQSVTAGGDALFSVAASSSGALTYQWQRNGVDIAGQTATTLLLKAVQSADNGAKITVVVKSSTTTVTSSAAVLTVSTAAATAYPVMFVTSVPSTGFSHQLNAFGNHGSAVQDAIAGGDLFIRYTDGTLRNLTKEAGWGVDSGGIQGGSKAISVRQPSMHWDGKKAVFSMMVGGPAGRYAVPVRNWQMYEVTGLGKGETVSIKKIANQPAAYNNISPIYGSDDNIIFISDAPLYGMANTYPQLDEYESAQTNTGVWKLDVTSGAVTQLEHAPSGVFDLFLDSYGRVLFTKWDHLQRDQEADLDRYQSGGYGAIDFESETSNVTKTYPQKDSFGRVIADAKGVLYDRFPQPRVPQDPVHEPYESVQTFNQFFVWQVNEDGTAEETINHLGRHELGGAYVAPSFTNDPNLTDALPAAIANAAMRGTFRSDAGIFQLREDVNRPGVYLGTYSAEFSRQASGRIVEFRMPPGMNPEDVSVTDYTNAQLDADPYGAAPATVLETGHYRSPLRLSDGSILVSHTPEYRLNSAPTLYKFQLKKLIANPFGTKDMIAGPSLTGGIVKDIRYWTDAATPVQYVGVLNEHDAIEVRSRPRPISAKSVLAAPEKSILSDESVDEAALRAWMQSKGLALIVSRNVTLRDRADVQQPYNLRVALADGTKGATNAVKSGTMYDISGLQIFQGELTRGYGNGKNKGRRVYARPIHNDTNHPDVANWYPTESTTNPAGSVKIGKDGSMAAFVPAGRALSWQLVSPAGSPVVRERVWVSFAPGEIRTCASCHGINSKTGNNLTEPQNPPEALRDLVRLWKAKK